MRSLLSVRPALRMRSARTPGSSGTVWAITILLFCACAGACRAQVRPGVTPPTSAPNRIDRAPHQFVSGDTVEIVARRVYLSLDRPGLSRYPFRTYTDFRARRPVPLSVLMQPKSIEPTRFARVIYGADLGASAASSLGGVGMVAGLWGGRTAGYLMGAGAVLGAIFGRNAAANEYGLRIRAEADGGSSPSTRHSTVPDQRD